MEIKNFGTVYLDGQPYVPGAESNGRVISFGDTVSEKAIPFVRWKSLWVASQCVCINISWEQLSKAGYIFGCPVKIDGTSYLCRSLEVGEESDVPNEWDSILDDLGEDDSLWHWSEQFFWGQETSKNQASHRAVRGWVSARRWNYYTATYRYVNVGFRPVLEPLAPEPLISDTLVGSNLEIYSSGPMFDGKLVDFSDYDLVISPGSPCTISDGCRWASMIGGNIVIEREAISWMKKSD